MTVNIVAHAVSEGTGAVLWGDSRGITTPAHKRIEVWNWAEDNGMTIEYQGTLSGIDLWYIKNDQDRTWFATKWA